MITVEWATTREVGTDVNVAPAVIGTISIETAGTHQLMQAVQHSLG
jgi:hypothetical protein